jgi:2'-5' RNA ligase
MKKRLFVAIPLEQKTQQLLTHYKKHFYEPNIAWTSPENLHITLYFLGNVEQTIISDLIDRINSVLINLKTFSLTFEQIILAPPHKTPRMIWVQFKKNKNYDHLCFILQNAIQKYESKNKPSNHQERIPHITLARFKGYVNITQEDLVQIDLPHVPIKACHLMESQLTPQGPVYKTISTCMLRML